MKILYGSCIGRAVRGSLCSPRSLSFSFALHIAEVVSNQLSCKRSFRLGSPEAKTQECRLLHNSFVCSWLQKLQCLTYTHLMGHLWSFIRAAERSLWFVFSHYTKDLTQALCCYHTLCLLYCAYLQEMKRKYLMLPSRPAAASNPTDLCKCPAEMVLTSVVYVLFAEHAGAMQCLCKAHHGKDPPSHWEGLPSPLLHLRDVPSQPGWNPLHRGCWWEHPLHRGLP